MIVRDHLPFYKLFFSMRGSVVPRIAPNILSVALLSLIILAVDRGEIRLPHISLGAMSVFGIALSLFQGFRNNAAYERWWEARTLWGRMVSDIRNLARETRLYLHDRNAGDELISMSCAFVHFHRAGLRKINGQAEAANWIGTQAAAAFGALTNPACAVLNSMAERLHEHSRSGALSGFGQRAFSDRIARISDSQAGCERIASTPLPFVYSLLVRRTTYLYCMILPFALIESAGYFTPVFAAVAAYVFFGLCAVTDELESPFGATANGLSLDALCRTIEISAAQAMSVEIPPAPKAENFMLT